MPADASSWYANPAARDWQSTWVASGASAFHAGLPGYAPTPLVELPSLATELGVGRVLIKDESSRLGLPAFKVLGASWASARIVAARTGAEVSFPALRKAAARSHLVLVTATDGNHGRAVAHMAALLGLSATVFVPVVMTVAAETSIASEGAVVVRVDDEYDEAVRQAAAFASASEDRELVQDTAWPGYEQVPGWIVEGYETMLAEIDNELGLSPDLAVVPVGVGSLAQAVVSHYRRPGAAHPCVLSVEPDTAACVLASLHAETPVHVETGSTIMAGLNCGTPSSAAWPVLHAGLDAASAVGDAMSAQAVTDLGRLGVSSGPSGAATLAGARAVLTGPGNEDRRYQLGIEERSVVVLLSTEANQQPHGART
jgi:diaminopropionate ammonia-lyase